MFDRVVRHCERRSWSDALGREVMNLPAEGRSLERFRSYLGASFREHVARPVVSERPTRRDAVSPREAHSDLIVLREFVERVVSGADLDELAVEREPTVAK